MKHDSMMQFYLYYFDNTIAIIEYSRT